MFSYRVPNVGFQTRTISRDKHPRARAVAERGKTRGSGGHQIFQPGAQPDW